MDYMHLESSVTNDELSFIARHCEVRSNLYTGRAALYSKEIASYLAMTAFIYFFIFFNC